MMTRSWKNCDVSPAILCTRLVHVVLTVAITVILFLKQTVFRIDLANGYYFHPIIYLLAVITSMILYFIVAFMDPGYVKRGDPDVKEIQLVLDNDDDVSLYEVKKSNSDNWNVELNEFVHNEKTKMLGNEAKCDRAKCFNLQPHERCGLCGLQRPLRAKHCRDCKRCVRRFDHHCPWITNCVGERNHKWFYIFLVLNLILLAWSMYVSTTAYSKADQPKDWASKNIILLLMDILIAILIFVVGTLFCIHTYLLVNNHTTWETMSRHRITYFKGLKDSTNPFNLGPCRNIFVFFCNFHPYDWTAVYSKTQKSSSNSTFDGGIESDEFCEITVDN